MRYLVTLLASLTLLAGFGSFSLFAADAQDKETSGQPAVPEGPIDIKGSKKTVVFSHQKGHEKIECVICHHEVEGKQTYAKCTDSGCHFDLTAKKGVNSLYYVVHSKSAELKHQSCMSCHVKTAEEKPDLKKMLTGCSGSACHPKAKKDASEDAAEGAAS